MKKMKVGDPMDRSTDHGPQNHRAHLDKLLEFCRTGVAEGATLLRGGQQVDRPGRWQNPVIRPSGRCRPSDREEQYR